MDRAYMEGIIRANVNYNERFVKNADRFNTVASSAMVAGSSTSSLRARR